MAFSAARVGPGYVGHFQLLSDLTTRKPVGDFAGRMATVELTAGVATHHFCDGTAWFQVQNPANVNITGGTVQLNNGTAAAPSYSFASDGTTGVYLFASGQIGFSAGSSPVFRAVTSAVTIPSANFYGWDSGALGTLTDLKLYRDAANILAQRNGLSPQTFNLYGMYTDGSNYERLAFVGNVGTQYIAAQSAGTGSANIGINMTSKGSGSIIFGTGGGTQVAVVSVPSAVNYVQLAGGATGGMAQVTAQGSDPNVPLYIANKGTAIMQLAGQTTGAVVGAAGAAAAIPTPAAYLTLNVNGTNYRVPLCN